MFIQILSHTPPYVWLLCALLFYKGWGARKDRVVSWKSLFLLPGIMLLWSLYAILTRYENIVALIGWAFSLSLGAYLGILITKSQPLRCDKQRACVEVTGSWTPLILVMALFSLRYFLGVMYGMGLGHAHHYPLLTIECIATVVSGMLAGRVCGYYLRKKTAQHTDLLSHSSK